MTRTILIVDDKKNTLKVLSAILADEGYTTLEASSAPQALDIIAAEEHIGAILSDLKMPGMDGLELFNHLKRVNRRIPFVLMTAHGTIQSAVEAMKNGIANYLIKPLKPDQMPVDPGKLGLEHHAEQTQPPGVFGGALLFSGRGISTANDVFQAFGFADEGEAGADFFSVHGQNFLMREGQDGGQ